MEHVSSSRFGWESLPRYTQRFRIGISRFVFDPFPIWVCGNLIFRIWKPQKRQFCGLAVDSCRRWKNFQMLQEGDELGPTDEKGNIRFSDVDYVDTWKAMENLVEIGLVKSIGVSNFNCKQLERLLKNCTIKPVTNQVFAWILKFQVDLCCEFWSRKYSNIY